MTRWAAALLLVAAACQGHAAADGAAPAAPSPVPVAATPVYRLLATAESEDQVALIEFRPCPTLASAPDCGARVVRTYEVGLLPADIEGPHGVTASPDGRVFYVTLAHGRPFGWLQKLDLATGRSLGAVELGMFPATVDIAPSGAFVYAINFNFEDPDVRPSSLSIVDGVTLTEAARPVTCRMPHGSRVNPQGTKHYSACMMDDQLVEVDLRSLAASRRLDVAPPSAASPPSAPAPLAVGEGAPLRHACSPTWAQPSADGRAVYVACNRSHEIVEVDVAGWRVTRRWTTPPTPYNLAVSPDGRLLVATQKGPGSTTVWQLSDATQLADIPGTRSVASGVAVSADSRYAFVTLEGVGGDPGTVDVIDLRALKRVASVDMGRQAGGIWVLP